MKRVLCACLGLAVLAACEQVPRRGKAIPVDYNRDTVLYQASCIVDADLRGLGQLSGVINTVQRPSDDCALQAMNTCQSNYRILHRTYGEAKWRLLDTHDRMRKPIPRRLRAQDLTIDFICLPGPSSAEEPIYVPTPSDMKPGEYFFTK